MDSTQKAILITAILSPITYPIGFIKNVWRKIFPTPIAGMPSEAEIHKEEESRDKTTSS